MGLSGNLNVGEPTLRWRNIDKERQRARMEGEKEV